MICRWMLSANESLNRKKRKQPTYVLQTLKEKEKHAVLWEGKNTTLHYSTEENQLLSIRKRQPIHPKNYSMYRISNLDGLTFETQNF
jgi:hypothetical protein